MGITFACLTRLQNMRRAAENGSERHSSEVAPSDQPACLLDSGNSALSFFYLVRSVRWYLPQTDVADNLNHRGELGNGRKSRK